MSKQHLTVSGLTPENASDIALGIIGIREDQSAAVVRGLMGGDMAAAEQSHAPTILPDGYHYTPVDPFAQPLPATARKTLIIGAHPSDAVDFHYEVAKTLQERGDELQVLTLTLGELGVEDTPRDVVVDQRLDEEAQSLEALGVTPRYLRTQPGPNGALFSTVADVRQTEERAGERHVTIDSAEHYFPDGNLFSVLPQLTDQIEAYILAEKPSRLLLHSLKPDHPDHVATTVATLNALERIQAKYPQYFTENPIDIILSDPEFGVAAGQGWAKDHIPVELGGNLTAEARQQRGWAWGFAGENTDHPTFSAYQYHYASQGTAITPSSDIRNNETPDATLNQHPLAVAPYIIASTQEMLNAFVQALAAHASQVATKPYGLEIPKVRRMRGLATDDQTELGAGFHPVSMEGITRPIEAFLRDLAQPGHAIFQLMQQEQAQQTDVTAQR